MEPKLETDPYHFAHQKTRKETIIITVRELGTFLSLLYQRDIEDPGRMLQYKSRGFSSSALSEDCIRPRKDDQFFAILQTVGKWTLKQHTMSDIMTTNNDAIYFKTFTCITC